MFPNCKKLYVGLPYCLQFVTKVSNSIPETDEMIYATVIFAVSHKNYKHCLMVHLGLASVIKNTAYLVSWKFLREFFLLISWHAVFCLSIFLVSWKFLREFFLLIICHAAFCLSSFQDVFDLLPEVLICTCNVFVLIFKPTMIKILVSILYKKLYTAVFMYQYVSMYCS